MYMHSHFVKIAIISLLISVLAFASQTLAQPAPPTQSQQLQEENTRLQAELADIERQIKQYEQELAGVRGEKNTLANKLKALQAQQSKLKLQIREVNVRIESLTQDISDTQTEINTNETHVIWLREQISAALREVYRQDQRSYLEKIFSEGGLSAFSQAVNGYKNLSQEPAAIVDPLKKKQTKL